VRDYTLNRFIAQLIFAFAVKTALKMSLGCHWSANGAQKKALNPRNHAGLP
jgi:hypothetical protein